MPKRDLVKRIDLNNPGLFGGGIGVGARTPQKYWAQLVVAAHDSTSEEKAGADYICDGIDDHIQINQALSANGGGSKCVVLLDGTFNIGNDIVMYSNTVLQGQGDSTLLNTGYKTPHNIGSVIDITDVSNVVIRNLQITNRYVFCSVAIQLDGRTIFVDDITIDNVLFHQCDNSYTIAQIGNFKRVSIQNCRFIDNDAPQAIEFYCDSGYVGEDFQVTGCSFSFESDQNNVAINIGVTDKPTATDFSDASLRNILIANNIYTGYEGSPTVGDWGAFAEIEGCVNVNITGNVVERCDEFSNLLDCFIVSITGNTMMYMGDGISCINQTVVSAGGGSQNCVISGNTIYNHYNHAITIAGPSNEASYGDWAGEHNSEDYRVYASITGNTIRYGHNTSSVFISTASLVVISGNFISDNVSYPGMEIYKVWLAHITGNEVRGCIENIRLFEVYDINIASNMIHDPVDDGIWMRESYRVTITGNHFFNAPVTIADDVGGNIGTDNLIVSHNTFYLSALGWEVTHSNTAYTNNIFFGDGSPYEIFTPLGVDDPSNFLISGNVHVGNGLVESNINASGKTTSQWAGGETSPTGVSWNGRFSRVDITPPSGLPEVDINGLVPENGVDGQVYIIGAGVEVGGGTYESVTILHGNNIYLDGGVDFEMNDPYDRLTMEYRGGDFIELSRSKASGFTYGSNLVVNPDVETGSPANWTAAGSAATWSAAFARSATHSLFINDTASSWTSDSFSVTAGVDYLVQASFLAPIYPGASKFRVEWYATGPSFISSDEITLSVIMPSWTTRQMFKTAPPTAITATVVFENDNTLYAYVPAIYVDDFAVKSFVDVTSSLTIATGVVTVGVLTLYTVLPESGTADDIDTISGGLAGKIIILRPEDSGDTITAKDGTGNLNLAGDFAMDSQQDTLQLVYDGVLAKWLELTRSNNA